MINRQEQPIAVKVYAVPKKGSEVDESKYFAVEVFRGTTINDMKDQIDILTEGGLKSNMYKFVINGKFIDLGEGWRTLSSITKVKDDTKFYYVHFPNKPEQTYSKIA